MEGNPRQSWIPDSTSKISPDPLTRGEITFTVQEELVFARIDSYRETMRVKENFIQKMI